MRELINRFAPSFIFCRIFSLEDLILTLHIIIYMCNLLGVVFVQDATLGLQRL